MKIKVIAVGNTLMEDDGVAIVVLEKLKKKLIKRNIGVVIGETDLGYAISSIEDGDFVFFIDAVYYGTKPGEITVTSLKKYEHKKKNYSQHGYSVMDLVKLYFKAVKGYIIGIEVAEIDFKYGLSIILKDNIDIISKNVFKEITSRI
ncbi:hydrogenase maturation protease [Clostridium guangxiense]|uniref:hydrogenase maturation protease n=1 Tax=Clostridium guangxiense TaxID=1662055 RepID=UPI001E6056F1|nr:hydrogenase maturation protease [Clostridium guangxiense]MCD2345569.1 hydrogenase maturation protease [Clostridium guangxiense]